MGRFKLRSKESHVDIDEMQSYESKTSKASSKKGIFSKLKKQKERREESHMAEEPVKAGSQVPKPATVGAGVHVYDEEDYPVALDVRDQAEEAKRAIMLEKQQNYVDHQTEHFKASDVRTKDAQFHQAVAANRPSARTAVMNGGMRYDWIDIETIAATRVQAAVRGNLCREKLIRSGLTTASMRNKMRERNARHHVDPDQIASEDVPFLARFCGIGLIFGKADEGLTDFEKERRRKEAEKNQRKREQLEREEMLRRNYRKQRAMNAKESIEVR